MWQRMLSAVAVLAGALASAEVLAGDLDAVKTLIGEIKVRIEHQEELTPAKDGRPPLKNDSWTFTAGGVSPTVRYGRYLNRPPEFNSSYPSLASGDMGVGLDGGPFGHW